MPLETLATEDRTEAALLDVRAVAALLSCSPRHVWRMHDRGAMPQALRLGALRKWTKKSILDWIADACPSCRKGGRP